MVYWFPLHEFVFKCSFTFSFSCYNSKQLHCLHKWQLQHIHLVPILSFFLPRLPVIPPPQYLRPAPVRLQVFHLQLCLAYHLCHLDYHQMDLVDLLMLCIALCTGLSACLLCFVFVNAHMISICWHYHSVHVIVYILMHTKKKCKVQSYLIVECTKISKIKCDWI